jgi:hypothetical protein
VPWQRHQQGLHHRYQNKHEEKHEIARRSALAGGGPEGGAWGCSTQHGRASEMINACARDADVTGRCRHHGRRHARGAGWKACERGFYFGGCSPGELTHASR